MIFFSSTGNDVQEFQTNRPKIYKEEDFYPSLTITLLYQTLLSYAEKALYFSEVRNNNKNTIIILLSIYLLICFASLKVLFFIFVNVSIF